MYVWKGNKDKKEKNIYNNNIKIPQFLYLHIKWI